MNNLFDDDNELSIVDLLLEGKKAWQVDFWTRPLTIEEFCKDPEHLRGVELSERQLKVMSEFLGNDPIRLFDKTFDRPNIAVLCWGKGCVAKTTRVLLADGTTKSIEQLIDEGKEVSVLSYNEETKTFEPKKASVPFKRGRGKMVRVKAGLMPPMDCYEDHLFYARRKVSEEPMWIAAKDLKRQNRILVPYKRPNPGNIHNPEKAREYGRLFYGYSADGLPEELFSYDDESLFHFLVGVVESQSRHLRQAYSVKGRKLKSKNYRVILKTRHRSVAEGTAILAHRIGFLLRSKLDFDYSHYQMDNCKYFFRDGKGSLIQFCLPYDLYRIYTFLAEDDNVITPALKERAKEAVQFYKSNKLDEKKSYMGHVNPKFNDGHFWVKIWDVKPIGEDDYYDLHVEDNETYVAENFVHHNSGKNMTTTILQQYVLYVLLCMRDPLKYFGFPFGESIDMINVASSAQQANKNFFAKFTRRIKAWKWLKDNFSIVQAGKPISDPLQSRGTIKINEDSVVWDGGVQCISAHSDSKGYEGYSPILWVMDEASSWSTEYMMSENGEQIAVSRAHSIFDTLRTSSVSRSWNWLGLVISYPRAEDDFTLNMAQAIKKGEIKNAYADIAATWDVKPWHLWNSKETFDHEVIRPWGKFIIKPPKDFIEEFRLHPTQSELKYACVPSRTNMYFIYQVEKIHECAKNIPPIVDLDPIEFVVPVNNDKGDVSNIRYIGYNVKEIRGDPNVNYYAHVDLSISRDSTCIAIGHAEPFNAPVELMVQDEKGERKEVLTQKIVIDQLIQWNPDPQRLVSAVNVDEILNKLDDVLRFKFVSMDMYNSAEVLEKMSRKGREAAMHNVNNHDYLLLRSLIHAGAIEYPNNPQLILELEKLVWTGKRVDHLPNFKKDSADTIAGIVRSIFLKKGKRKQRVQFQFIQ